MNSTKLKPEIQRIAQEIYEQNRDVIDSDAKNANGWQKAVALTFIQLAEYDGDTKSYSIKA